MARSGLDVLTLQQVWALADGGGDGRLDLAEYLVACFLVTRCVRLQRPPPTRVPPSLFQSARRAAELSAATAPPLASSAPPLSGWARE